MSSCMVTRMATSGEHSACPMHRKGAPIMQAQNVTNISDIACVEVAGTCKPVSALTQDMLHLQHIGFPHRSACMSHA